MVDLLSLVPDAAGTALAQWLAERGEPAYRARQLLPRLWERPVGSWDEATELPAALRRALTEALPLRRLALSARQVSQDSTEKYLWDLGDGEAVESVLIPEGKRRTLCISSQGACGPGGVFGRKPTRRVAQHTRPRPHRTWAAPPRARRLPSGRRRDSTASPSPRSQRYFSVPSCET